MESKIESNMFQKSQNNIQSFRITWSMDYRSSSLYLLVAWHAMGTHAGWTCRNIWLKHQLMESGAIIQPYKVGAMFSFLAPWFLPQLVGLSMFFILLKFLNETLSNNDETTVSWIADIALTLRSCAHPLDRSISTWLQAGFHAGMAWHQSPALQRVRTALICFDNDASAAV